jgi:hypothetical protein
MSVRTWDAGSNQNAALFIMMLFWALLILLVVAQTNWQWNLPTIFGLIFIIGVLDTWIISFTWRRKPRQEGQAGLTR